MDLNIMKNVHDQKVVHVVVTQLLRLQTFSWSKAIWSSLNNNNNKVKHLHNFFIVKQTIWNFWVNEDKIKGVLQVTVINTTYHKLDLD